MNAFNAQRRVAALLANLSLRTMLIVCFSALAIGMVGTVGMLAHHTGRQAVTTLARQLLDEVGNRINQRLSSYFSVPESIVRSNAALIRQGRFDLGDSAALERHFAEQLRLFTGVDSIGLVTEQRELIMLARYAPDALILRRFNAATGHRLYHYRAGWDGQPQELIESRQNYDPHNDPPDNPWYPAVRKAGRGGWRLSVSLAKGQDQPVLVSFYYQPFHDSSEVLRGVLVAGITLIGASEFLEGLNVSANGQAFLVDRQGLLVATSTGETPFDNRARIDHAQNVAVQTRRLPAIASTRPLTSQTTQRLLALEPALERLAGPLRFDFAFGGQRYFARVAPLQDQSDPDWLIVTVAPEADFTALLTPHLYRMVLPGSLVLLIAILLGLLAAHGISRPLRQLNAATRRLADGNFHQPIPPAPIRELRDLGESFEKMAGRLCDTFAELHAVNQTLRIAEQELAEDKQRLEERVAARTAELGAAQARIVATMAQLQANEQKIRKILDNIPAALAISTLESTPRVTYLNEQFVRTFGYTVEDIPTVSEWAIRAYPDPQYRIASFAWWDAAMVKAIAAQGNVESRAFQVMRKDGAVREVIISATVLEDLLLGSFLDITDRKRAEAAAEKASRARSEFLAQMTHDLRTPLHAILGFAEVLNPAEHQGADPAGEQREDSAIDQGRRRELLATIQRNGRHLLALVNNILDLSRMEHGGLDLEPSPTHLRCLLRDCIRDLAPLAEAKGLALHLELDAGLPDCIQVDGQRLRQILDNLLGNAAKFTGQGEIRLRAEAIPGLNHSGPVELRITVADTGPGITATDQERIFAAFVQIAPGGGSAQGSGLGLAISRQLASLMGGRIRLDSVLGAGSRFTLTLPAVPLADGCACHGPASGDDEASPRRFGRTPGPAAPDPLPPPAEALRELRELAELGRTTRLEAWCRRWSAPERCPAFAARVLELALAFENDRIVDLADAGLSNPGLAREVIATVESRP